MAKTSKVGRPAKAKSTLTKSAIMNVALPILREKGVQELSFRVLAAELGVTAMAVSYHCGSKKELLRDLVELGFRGTIDDVGLESSLKRVREVLEKYCLRALDNANLLRAVLDDTSLMSNDLHTITDVLQADLQKLGAEDDVLHLLIDYTHGFVLSASSGQDNPLTIKDYLPGIDWVLNRLEIS